MRTVLVRRGADVTDKEEPSLASTSLPGTIEQLLLPPLSSCRHSSSLPSSREAGKLLVSDIRSKIELTRCKVGAHYGGAVASSLTDVDVAVLCCVARMMRAVAAPENNDAVASCLRSCTINDVQWRPFIVAFHAAVQKIPTVSLPQATIASKAPIEMGSGLASPVSFIGDTVSLTTIAAPAFTDGGRLAPLLNRQTDDTKDVGLVMLCSPLEGVDVKCFEEQSHSDACVLVVPSKMKFEVMSNANIGEGKYLATVRQVRGTAVNYQACYDNEEPTECVASQPVPGLAPVSGRNDDEEVMKKVSRDVAEKVPKRHNANTNATSLLASGNHNDDVECKRRRREDPPAPTLKVSEAAPVVKRRIEFIVDDDEGEITILDDRGKQPRPITRREKLEIEKVLHVHQANLHAVDEKGNTLLFIAVHNDKVDVVRGLLACGANVNHRNHTGETALATAIRRKSDVMVRLLIGSGADVNVGDNEGYTPLMTSLLDAEGRTDISSSLLKLGRCNVNATTNLGYTALALLLLQKPERPVSVAVMQWLRSSGADPNVVDGRGYTLLSQLVLTGRLEMTKVLLRTFGVQQPGLPHLDVNAKDVDSEMTPLQHCCMSNGSRDIAVALVSAGARADVLDRHGRSLLTIACERGYHRLCEVLVLFAKCDPSSTNDKGHSLLLLAAFHGHREVAIVLARLGAVANTHDGTGVSALSLLVHNGCMEGVKILLECCAADIDIQDKNSGYTPLMTAARKGDDAVVKYLLSAGADVAKRNKWRETARAVAEKNGHVGIASILKEK